MAFGFGYVWTIGSLTSGTDNYHLRFPTGVAINASDAVYVVDNSNGRVQVFNDANIYQYTLGNGRGIGDDQFFYPWGATVNGSGYIYVSEQASTNTHVSVWDKTGAYQYKIGTGSGTGNYQFRNPAGVAVNASGFLFVADSLNNRVQVYDKAGIYQYTINGSGSFALSSPHGVAVNQTGCLFIADTSNDRVQIYDEAGNYLHTINGSAGNYNLWEPYDVAINGSGYIFVADTFNQRVQIFSPSYIYQYTIGVTGVYGTDNDHFHIPYGVAINSSGSVYVADAYNNRTQVFQLYYLPPSELGVEINGGVLDTPTSTVTLSLSAVNVTDMCFSSNGTTYTSWESFNPSKSWTFDGGPGLKIVYFKVRNPAGEAGPVFANISYTLPPTGLAISINGGATETNTTSVRLTLAATGATQMSFSNDGITWSSWESFATTKQWTLAEGAGTKTVYFRARNSTIEAFSPATDTISYGPSNSDWWIIPALIAIALGAVVALVAYVRTRHQKVERFWETSLAKLTDVLSIQHVLVIHKDTGTAILSQSMRGKVVDGDLISGFLTALTSFKAELGGEKRDLSGKKGFTLDYKDFKILLEDRIFIRTALILGGEASDTMKVNLVRFITLYEERFYNELKEWKGNLKTVEGGGDIIEQVFEVPLIYPYLPNLTADKQQMSSTMQQIFGIAQLIAMDHPPLLLTDLLKQTCEKLKKPEGFCWTMIYEMTQQGILEPVSIEKRPH